MINPTGKKFLCVCDKVFEIQSVNVAYCEPLCNYVNGAPVEVTKKHTQKVEISGENDLKISFIATTEELEASPTMRRLLFMPPLAITLGKNTKRLEETIHVRADQELSTRSAAGGRNDYGKTFRFGLAHK